MVDYSFPQNEILFPHGGINVKSNSTLLIEMGNRLRRQRKQMRLTQEKLAELSELSVKTIISAEKGQKALRPENIVQICRSLEMDISYMMTGEISQIRALSSLNHQERIALDKIIDAFLSICGQSKEL